jgi:hypothetical protein
LTGDQVSEDALMQSLAQAPTGGEHGNG